ncbi:MAG: DinB family protein [Thermomicrobiales bacterium]
MNTHDLFLETGPEQRETMVHVLTLPGCMLTGPTVAAALAATPAVIQAFVAFQKRHGVAVESTPAFTTNVVAYDINSNTTGYDFALVTFPSELADLTPAEIDQRIHWIRALSSELSEWADRQTAAELDRVPEDGAWTARQILVHMLEAQPGYVERILQTPFDLASTLSSVQRGEMAYTQAFDHACDVIAAGINAATEDQRRNRIPFDDDITGTLTRALRRTAEHIWEHLLELSRRPGGPDLGLA